jgi:hypothetical protein
MACFPGMETIPFSATAEALLTHANPVSSPSGELCQPVGNGAIGRAKAKGLKKRRGTRHQGYPVFRPVRIESLPDEVLI